MKRMSAISILILLALALSATFATTIASADHVNRHRRHPTTTTTTRPPTTTTTRPSTTTTTRPPTTTTTTLPPTTTTTFPPLNPSGDRYDFMVNNNDLGLQLWVAPYYLDLGNGFGWGFGNRDGYRCMYGVLVEGDALTSQDPLGRFRVVSISDAASYIIINDRYMPDKGPLLRHYDTGLLDPPDGVRQGECPPPDNANYEPYFGPGELPVIDFISAQGQLLERRDYRNVDIQDPRLKFQLLSANSEVVTVMSYWDNLPIAPIYYDAPSEWNTGVTMNGYIP